MECKINMLFIVLMICTIFHRPFVFIRPCTPAYRIRCASCVRLCTSGDLSVAQKYVSSVTSHIINLSVYMHYSYDIGIHMCASSTRMDPAFGFEDTVPPCSRTTLTVSVVFFHFSPSCHHRRCWRRFSNVRGERRDNVFRSRERVSNVSIWHSHIAQYIFAL